MGSAVCITATVSRAEGLAAAAAAAVAAAAAASVGGSAGDAELAEGVLPAGAAFEAVL